MPLSKSVKSPPRVLIALNTTWNIANFRAGLVRALIEDGFEVIAVAPADRFIGRVEALGCRHVALPMDNQGKHPGRDLLLLWRFFWLLRRERPDVFLGYTVKPNIFGSLAAHLLGIPVINNIAGLGAAFIQKSWLTRVVCGLYRLALSRSIRVFFQNDDDLKLFLDNRIVASAITARIPGSGIELREFLPVALPDASRPIRFLLIARMLWDKGVREYIEAAKLLNERYINTEFCLLGFLDVQNPAAISTDQMNAWVAEGVVQYLGETEDVRPYIAAATCVVLPSYREGTPRALLEAAAMGRPIVTTDAVGCREVVDDGVNGYLCRVRDAADLADKMAQIIEMGPVAQMEMGRRGRQKVAKEFDEAIVIASYMESIAGIVSRNRCAGMR